VELVENGPPERVSLLLGTRCGILEQDWQEAAESGREKQALALALVLAAPAARWMQESG